jgi:hypothetical protein
LAAVRQAPGVEVVVAVRVSSLTTGYVYGHSKERQPVQGQVSLGTLLVEVQQRAEGQVSVAQQQAWVQVSVALDGSRA